MMIFVYLLDYVKKEKKEIRLSMFCHNYVVYYFARNYSDTLHNICVTHDELRGS